MRKTILAAGLVALTAACGGEKTAEEPAMTPDQPAVEAPAPAAGTTGTTHDVNMVLEGTSYKYSPAELTIKAGDVVRFHNISGGPHNVDFWADSIPAGAAAVLNAAMPDRMGELSGPLLGDRDHLGGEVDAGDLRAVLLGQEEHGAADAAADIEHGRAGDESAIELGAEVFGRFVAAGADVPSAEDPLVSQNPFAGVLAVVVVRRGRCVCGLLLLGRHGVPSVRG